jgi:riboflavin-specific deaminase-like protein
VAATEVDALAFYGKDDRRPPAGRPYVIVNMVASVDGATAVDGVTKALGSPTDRAIFLHLREIADAILVGASTVRAERYGPARPGTRARAQRADRGQWPRPPIVVVSRSLDFEWSAPFFTEADPPPVLLAPGDANPVRLESARQHAEVSTYGERSVDLAAALADLRDRGVAVLLCEGGPTLNTELLAAGLIDELCLTIAPRYIGGSTHRGIFAAAPAAGAVSFDLLHVLEEDGFLYCRYRVAG